MDTLRLILILVGIALVGAIYLWDRIKSRRREGLGRWQDMDNDVEQGRIDPLLSDDNPFAEGWEVRPIQARRDSGAPQESLDGLKGIVALTPDDILEEGMEPVSSASPSDAAPQEEVVILSLMAPAGDTYNGMQLLDAMELCGLHYGDMGIFHYTDLDSDQTLFSIANVLEPGSFDINDMGAVETPGLALFMRLPAPIDGEKALLTFVQQAKRLKEQLHGRLTDRQRRELTRETLDELKATARRYRVTAE